MMRKPRKKRPVTLIEIMIVIFLIGLIGSVLAFNLKGSLDEGKKFKTEQGIEQVHNILMLGVAQGISIDDAVSNWQKLVKDSAMAGKPETLIKDGWGQVYQVGLNQDGTDIIVQSTNLERYLDKQRSKTL